MNKIFAEVESNETVRPLARTLARELSAEEINQIGGGTDGQSPCGGGLSSPAYNGDMDVYD